MVDIFEGDGERPQTLTITKTKTQTAALTLMMMVGVGGLLAILMSIGEATYYGCGGGGGAPILKVKIFDTPNTTGAVIGGSQQIVGEMRLKAQRVTLQINSFAFVIEAPDEGMVGGPNEIAIIHIFEGEQELGSAPLLYDDFVSVEIPPFILDKGEEKTLTVKETFREVNAASPAESGAGFTTRLADIGVNIYGSTKVPFKKGIGKPFGSVWVFKSLPFINNHATSVTDRFDEISFNTTDGHQTSLFYFDVTADSNGPVGIYKFTFEIEATNSTFSPDSLILYESDNSTTLGNIIAAGEDIITAPIGTSTPTSSSYLAEIYFDVNNDNSNAPAFENRIINAGTRKYYTLQGVTSEDDWPPNNESISIKLLTDIAFAGIVHMNAQAVDDTENDNFVWSDLHLSMYASSTATSSDMFYNGYRVLEMEHPPAQAK